MAETWVQLAPLSPETSGMSWSVAPRMEGSHRA
jgi:hypothetical protein